MTENFTIASFPVVFSDGEREIDLGSVSVHPSLEFKNFRSFLSQKIGIPPQQIAISLIRRKPSRSPPENRRRIPITDKVDFSTILEDKDCFFFVTMMKRSRRERRGTGDNHLPPRPINSLHEKIPPPEKILLRRDSGMLLPFYGQTATPEYLSTGQGMLGLGRVDYENQIRKLQRMREKFMMSTANTNPRPYTEYESVTDHIPTNSSVSVVCEVCSDAKGTEVPFHQCVYDAVTVGFRSPAGPIARPPKQSG
uniref:DUF7138 domain-containing protein n=1 Tax=Nelumbo nucifera TaxID=4432 RepID=A0A822YHJ8_NELNU|nr:TPA_asm: hypothetical protein HUJ06_030406 [Nelumbo nucifera]